MTKVTMDAVVERYIQLRDKKERINTQAKAEIHEINGKMAKLEQYVQMKAKADGVNSFKTDKGTAYLKETPFASVSDWDAILAFVREHDLYHMLTKGVSKLAVKDYLDHTNAVPPGVKYGTVVSVGVRKPTNQS